MANINRKLTSRDDEEICLVIEGIFDEHGEKGVLFMASIFLNGLASLIELGAPDKTSAQKSAQFFSACLHDAAESFTETSDFDENFRLQ